MKNKLKLSFPVVLLVLISMIPGSVKSQNAGTIEGYTLGVKDLVVLPFGMGQKIVVGKVDPSGNLQFDWSSFDISKVQDAESNLGDFRNNFDAYCNEEIVENGSVEGIQMVKGGSLYVYNENFWEGALTAASSTELKDHLLDQFGMDAVEGQYLDWVYADREASYKSTCITVQSYMDAGDIEQKKHFDLNLKKGWNLIIYEIREVIPVENAAATAVDILISTAEEYPDNINWYLKKF
jgi:hypothetical protein